MADRIEREAEFLAAHSELALHIVKNVKALNTAVREAAENAVDLKGDPAGGPGRVGFLQTRGRGKHAMWVTLAIFAVNSFLSLHRPSALPISRHVTRIEQPA